MADIRIEDLPLDASPAAGDFLAIDGATTRKTTIQAAVEIGRPVASQAEAEAGVNNTKVMTPLTTLQSLTVNAASPTQGAKADTALQPGDIGVSVQGFDALLQAVAALVTVADRLIYTTGVDTVALTELTGFARTLLDDADAAAARSTLGLGTLSTLNTINNGNWSGTDLAVANGGTGASDAATALSNLGGQPLDAFLTSIAGLTVAAGGFLRTSAADTAVAQAIVGTVSQSGGTPTGSLFEEGSNANGSFVRLPSGIMICHNEIDHTSTAVTTALGSIFAAYSLSATFPSTFSSAPHVVITGKRNSDSIIGADIRADPTTTGFTYNMWAATSTGSALAKAISYIAIGRWF